MKIKKITDTTVAYCSGHVCSITEQDLRIHKCCDKKCKFFVKLNNDFWNTEIGKKYLEKMGYSNLYKYNEKRYKTYKNKHER